MSEPVDLSQKDRLALAADEACRAEEQGDWVAANDAWARYRLIRDAQRDPDELLAEGVELSTFALELASGE